MRSSTTARPSDRTPGPPPAEPQGTGPNAATLPDGPRRSRLTQGTLWHRHPLGFLQEAQRRFGDVFTVRLALTGTVVVCATPEAIEPVLGADPMHGHGGEARRRVLGMVSDRSVLGADGPAHRRARSRLAAAFAPEAIDRQRPAMAEITAQHVARWPRNRPLRLAPRLRSLTDEIFLRLVVGVRDADRARMLGRAVQRMLSAPGNPPSPPPGEQAGLLGVVGKRVFDRRVAPVAELLGAEIDLRRRAGDLGGPDIIGLLLADAEGGTTDELVDELLPVLMAGQEPPAVALAWLLDRLGREPDAADHVVAAPDDDPLREAIIKETLRLRAPVHSSVRRLITPLEVAGRTLPAGVIAMLPIVALHHDPRCFPDPRAFRPERFLDGGAQPAAHLPFGGGARRCLGEPLAHAQIATVLPEILRTVRVRPLWPVPERMVVRGTVLVPHRSGLAVLQDRRQGPRYARGSDPLMRGD